MNTDPTDTRPSPEPTSSIEAKRTIKGFGYVYRRGRV